MSQQQYKHYARAATHAKFTAILATLPAALTPTGGVPPTTKDLARLVEKLQRLQQLYFEDHAEFRSNGGAHQPHPLPFPRIPTKLFKNYSPGGPLQRIIHAAFTYRIKKGFRKWDVDNPAKKALFEDMLRYIAEDLSSCGMIADPVLAFASDVALEVRAELAPLATLMRAKVVPKITPLVTHVLHHAGNHVDNGEEEQEGEWYRTLEKQDGHVLLHYWYKPDSADVWVPEASGDYLDPEPAPVHKGPWFISTRWLKDSYKFLEWANEEDYERGGGEAGNGDVKPVGRESAAATPRTSSAPATVNGEESDDVPSDNDEEGEEEEEQDDEDDEDDDEDDEEEEEGDDTKSRKSQDDDRPRNNSVNAGGGGREQASEQGGLKPYPRVRVVDLDEKGTRIRRYEYEPFKNAVLHNMSWTIGATMPTGVASYAGDRRANSDQAWEFLQVQTSQPAIAMNPQGSTLPADGVQPDASKGLQAPASSPAPPPRPPPPPSGQPYTETPAELATHRIVNLAHAPWFAFDSVHPCEKLHFPEFFDQATTTGPQSASSSGLYPPRSAGAYLHIRNSLIVAFRRNMTQYLGIEEACRRLGERVEDVAKVLRFLTHWGLINLQISESAPTGASLLQAGRLRSNKNSSDPSGKSLAGPHTSRSRTVAEHRHYVYASPLSKSPPPPPDSHQAAPTTSTQSALHPPPLASASPSSSSTTSAISSSLSSPQLRHAAVLSCETCLQQLRPQAPHYVLFSPPNVLLCHDCFTMGRYPFTLSSRDFIRVEPVIPHPTTAHPHEFARFQIVDVKNASAHKAAHDDNDDDAPPRDWSERETLQLLDAVARLAGKEAPKQESPQHQSHSIKPDPDIASTADAAAAAANLPVDWDQVAKHVPQRTREECLARFFTLQILRDLPSPSGDNRDGNRGSGSLRSSSNDRFTSLSPLETSANPVMHLIAAIEAAINPGIAAECAKHALVHLAKMNSNGYFDVPLGETEEHYSQRRKQEMELVDIVVREAAAPAAQRLARAEDQELEILARALADAQLRKMELKMAALKEVK
ncbi:SWI SNF, matrix associated, actin dependent regulator of chromatin, sub c, member 2 [Geranomyces variabilis]|uniref:SWI SNF, matrix associated, actin dependent regulator of chromatin, sub c, member 2 n=1 Tax=Geranomyces variabilis TaxID=109894 RepID=A0AAD5XNY6_9FUNG|nr:SWI SNF, matrix associated, actin dependent regulator of chromatin, sub c, member 2 [Geranomyces variabilis]